MRKRRTSKKLKVKAVNDLVRLNVLSIDILLDFYNGGANEKD